MFFWKLEAYSKRYYQPTASTRGTLSRYWTLDANVEYAVSRHSSIRVGVANLADESYQTNSGISNLGRTLLRIPEVHFLTVIVGVSG